MKHKQNGFGILGLLLVVVVFAAVGGTGWYVYKNNAAKKVSKEPASSVTKASAPTTNSIVAQPPKLDEQKVPAGWNVEQNKSDVIELTRIEIGCSAEVTYTTDTANSNAPNVDHYQQAVEAIQSKGYTAGVSDTTLAVHTTAGDKTLKAKNMKVAGEGANLMQRYAFVSNTQYFEGFQLSCAHEADIPAAESALQAITVAQID